MTTSQPQKTVEPSIYQSAIFAWAEDLNPEYRIAMINAVAGSGKSTTLKMVCFRIPGTKRILFVAFAKRNVEDLRPGLPANAEAKTLNSVGNSAWLRFIGKSFQEAGKDFVNGSLNYRFIDECISEEGVLCQRIKTILVDRFRKVRGAGKDLETYGKILDGNFLDEVRGINSLIGLAKGAGIVPSKTFKKVDSSWSELTEDTSGKLHGLTGDTHEDWRGLIEEYDLDITFPEVAIEVARWALARSIQISDTEIDYDSQLWLPIIHNADFPKYDWILADEVQDQNFIQNEMISRMMRPDTRAIFVGDPFQSIYMFRGALSNGMEAIKQRFGATEFPLSICYRCAKSIVAHAKALVPHIEHHDGQSEGKIMHAEEFGPAVFTKNDVVLCRNSRPLIELAHKLFKAKVPNRVLGKDIEHGLVRLAKKCAGRGKNFDVIDERLEQYKKRETEKYTKRHQMDMVRIVVDKVETLEVFIRELPEAKRSLRGLVESIENVFKVDKYNKTQMLILSTVHKAKGTEHDHVFILEPHLMPSKYADSKEAQQQERNIMYVARTRAIKTLTYINLEDYNPEYKSKDVLLQKEAA